MLSSEHLFFSFGLIESPECSSELRFYERGHAHSLGMEVDFYHDMLVAQVAQRPDLARPIVEELHALIEELHLDRWESPVWVAEVLDAYYRCLTSGEPSDDDLGKARMLFQRLCTTDVTKAITYRHG